MQDLLNLMRWDKPIGTWLLFWPCSWSIVLAASTVNMSLLPMLNLIALFFLGAFFMRSAGCIINDMWDRKYDAQVERTKNRPLASGALSVQQAMVLLIILLFCSLLIVTQLKIQIFYFALAALPFVVIYPLMKRITWWPQAFLGLTFNFGALMGWVAVTGELATPAILLYISGIFWTLGYDTIYAFQDINDDKNVGIKSTAIRLETTAKQSVAMFFIISFSLYLAALYSANIAAPYFITTIGAAILLFLQMKRFDPQNSHLCLSQFKAHTFYGFLILITPVVEKLS